jgi:IclR family transcriptional regulator, pca regulon regulatory protein
MSADAKPKQRSARGGAADMTRMFEQPERFSQSLRLGLAVLSSFSSERPMLGIAELAEELDMSRSTTHRYAATLATLGYLEQGASRRYRLAPRVADVGLALLGSMALRTHARVFLEDLREKTGNTVSIAILDGTEIFFVDRLRGWGLGQRGVDPQLGPASRLPAHCTALGKMLLACLPEPVLSERIAQTKLTRGAPHRIANKKALRSELAQVLADGLATDDEELAEGLRAIAAAVRDGSGEVVAAVEIAVPASAFAPRELIDVLGPLLGVATDGVSAAIANDSSSKGRRPRRARAASSKDRSPSP